MEKTFWDLEGLVAMKVAQINFSRFKMVEYGIFWGKMVQVIQYFDSKTRPSHFHLLESSQRKGSHIFFNFDSNPPMVIHCFDL